VKQWYRNPRLRAILKVDADESTTEELTEPRKPILLLFFLSPLIGEGLSGSTPPLAFLNPAVTLLLACLYGSGALLVRDYARRWQKGWRSILILGAAYGIIEEGIMVRSFFSPTWKDLGLLATYGRWLGTNWVWAEWLAIYHAIFSITIPIFLVELTYPQSKTRIWLSWFRQLFGWLTCSHRLQGLPSSGSPSQLHLRARRG
jgi:hypothetical protein